MLFLKQNLIANCQHFTENLFLVLLQLFLQLSLFIRYYELFSFLRYLNVTILSEILRHHFLVRGGAKFEIPFSLSKWSTYTSNSSQRREWDKFNTFSVLYFLSFSAKGSEKGLVLANIYYNHNRIINMRFCYQIMLDV